MHRGQRGVGARMGAALSQPKVIVTLVALLGGAALVKCSMYGGRVAPVINDISTDLTDPPAFISKPKIPTLPPSFVPQIRSFYSDVQPLTLQRRPQEAFELALKVASGMSRWDIRASQDGQIEGVATTLIMRFKDDFAIRVRPDGPSGSRVDMRSRSRLGKGDMGTNAARIKDFLARLSHAAAADSSTAAAGAGAAAGIATQ